MHISGDHSNYIVEIDTSKIPGRVIPIVSQKDWRALVPELEMLTEEARDNFTEAMQKSKGKHEYLVLFRGLLDPTLFKVLPTPAFAAEGRTMPVMLDDAKQFWFQNVWDLTESNLRSAREFLQPEICSPKSQIPGEPQGLTDSVQDLRGKLFSPDSKTRSSADQDSFAVQQHKRLKQTKAWKSWRTAHSQTPSTAHCQTPSTAHSQTPSQALPRQLADQEGSVEVKEWKIPNMEKAQMTMVDKEHPLEQLMPPAKVEDQEQQQSKQQQKNEASAQETVDSKNRTFVEIWWHQQVKAEQEKQQKKQQKKKEEQEQEIPQSRMALAKQEAQQKQKDLASLLKPQPKQHATQHLAELAERAQAKEAAEQAAAEEEQWHEVQGWLASTGFGARVALPQSQQSPSNGWWQGLVDEERF